MKDSQAQETLLAAAREASAHAWSPYSGVRVGAAVLGPDGRIYVGCNVESASYGLTQCAERNALSAAIAAGERPGSLSELLVYSIGFDVLSPCGACRQVMSELLAPGATVTSMAEEGEPRTWDIGALLPDPFKLEET